MIYIQYIKLIWGPPCFPKYYKFDVVLCTSKGI